MGSVGHYLSLCSVFSHLLSLVLCSYLQPLFLEASSTAVLTLFYSDFNRKSKFKLF